MAEIRLRDVAHRYPNAGEDALRLGDFCWEDGGAYALLGPSGCGKTTLLNIISGLVTPSRGRVFFDGNDVTDHNPRARNIAQVFQFPVIYDTMTVFNNLGFPLRNRGMDKKQITTRVHEVAERLDLSSNLHNKAKNLSADQKQLISLGRGLVRNDVSAILFDEPLTVIDPHQKFKLRRILKDIHRRFKLTLIYVTHDQSEALTFADQVAVMNLGEVLQQGSPEILYQLPAHRFVGHFIGNPGMNFLPATIQGDRLMLQDQAIAMDDKMLSSVKGTPGELVLGVRPEYLQLSEHKLDQQQTALSVRLESTENHGNYFMLNVNLSGQKLVVKSDVIPQQKDLYLYLPQQRTHLYLNDRLVD